MIKFCEDKKLKETRVYISYAQGTFNELKDSNISSDAIKFVTSIYPDSNQLYDKILVGNNRKATSIYIKNGSVSLAASDVRLLSSLRNYWYAVFFEDYIQFIFKN